MRKSTLSMLFGLLTLTLLSVGCQPATQEPISTESKRIQETMSLDEDYTLNLTIATSKGDIHLTLFAGKTPVTVGSFVNLAQRGYYDNLSFHRVLDNFMVQGGCPLGTGTGGPGYNFEDECRADLPHDVPGKLSMANAGPGTNGSQFFITHVPTDWLDGKHTVFGAVVGSEDQDVVNAVQQGDTITGMTVEGDTAPLFAHVQDRIDEWNGVLGD